MGKVTKIFKISPRLWILSVCTFSISLVSFAQDSLPLSGVFEGEHIEYAIDGSNDTLNYIYKFELEQEDKQVVGQSYIYNDEGYYAVVKLRGILLEDEFYFEEYNTLDEINPEESSWCYNSGHLKINRNADEVLLTGYTKSYTKDYGAFCRAGYTNLTQTFNPAAEEPNNETITIEPAVHIFLEPNPTEAESNLHFTLQQSISEVIIEVRDLQGELILEPLNRELPNGDYEILIDLSFQKEGMYIVELIVDRKLYTAELWKEIF